MSVLKLPEGNKMLLNIDDIQEYVEEHDVKFIRLVFADIFGKMKNISIMVSELQRAREEGITFDASEISGFMNVEESDLLLYPNTYTGEILPWRPQEGRVIRFFCDIKYPDGKPFEGDSRYLLRRMTQKLAALGLTCKIGIHPEFYLFCTDDMGQPSLKLHDYGSYFDVSPIDGGENIRREICLNLEQMGICPQSSFHALGPGQHGITFRSSDPLSAADHLLTFKNMVKTVSSLNGLYASFMPKPIAQEAGNGLSIDIELQSSADGRRLSDCEGGMAQVEAFAAGIMNRIEEMTAFLNPTTNSYKRFGEFEAPKYITWSRQNRQQLMRISDNGCVTLRSPDLACNPHISYALLLAAGIEGIENTMKLCEPVNVKKKDGVEGAKILPQSLAAALDIAEGSTFIKGCLPGSMMAAFLDEKRKECTDYDKAADKELFDYNRYFVEV